MNEALPRDIRCVLIPAGGGPRLLLPNAAIAEVIALPIAEPLIAAPAWLLGRIAWRGWKVPLLSYASLIGAIDEPSEVVLRVAVLKAPSRHAELPFLAMLIRGFPRLLTLNAELIIPTHDDTPLPPGVRVRVLVRDEVAVIPDLEAIERAIVGREWLPATD